MVYIDPSAYVNSGDPVYAYYDINCTIPNKNYTLEVSLSNSTGYYNLNSWNWYENDNYEHISEIWFNLNPGQYCVNATLWDVSNGAMNYVDGEYPCFTITASNNGGNNNGGGNNSMNGNNSGNNTGGGNNTNNSCANGSMYNDLITAINPNSAPQGITIVGNYYVDCTVIGESYVLEATTIGQNVQFYDYEVWNWTETNNYESMVDYFYNLMPGYYCTNVTLMLTTGGAQQILDIDYHCFTITNSSGSGNNTGNNTGGGNNSGNNTGGGNNTNNTCGNDPNLTDLMVYIDPSAYVNSGDPVYAYYDINCTIPNKNYTLEVSLSNSTGYYNLNSWNWYENDNYEHISEIWFNLNPGQYCVNATLWDVSNGAMNYVDVEYPCFTITASNNGGGNNGGGNNSGNNTGGGNNTNNTCGNDPSLTNLMVWTDMTTYQYGDLVTSNYFVDCTIPGKTYELHVDAYSAAWGDYLIFTWNENNDYEDLYNVWQNLDNGTYCVRTTLYEIGGNGHQYLDYGETCFVVVANNNGGGNNNNNTCGNDPSLTELMIWTDMTTYQFGDVVMSEYYVNCSINGKHYELHVHSYGINSNSWNDYTVWNWTETDQYEIFNNYWQNLSIGSYCINATLYEVSGGTYQYIDMEFTCFDVVGNPNGGGSVDPCGLNASYTQIYEWTDATIYNLGDDQNITFYVNCTRVGASYYLEYFVYEVGSTFGPLTYGFSWTANSISTNHYATLTGLSAGDYCILSELSEPYPNLLTSSSGSTCFTIVAPNQPPYLMHTHQLPYTYANDPLNCYHQGMYYNDPENDPDQSIFTWYINNVQISTGILNNVLPAGITSLGDDVVCEAIAHDGISQGNTVLRWFAVIPANNSAPTVSAVTISPTSPEEGDTITCSYTYNDPENDPDASLIQWSINSVAIPTATTNSISTGFAAGDFVTCTVTANDGTVSGNTNTGTVLILTEGSGGSVPSIGLFGTIVALGAGFVLFSRRKLQ